MARVAILFGALLVVLGLVGYLAPDTLGKNESDKTSPTALIPAGIGAILLLCGLIVEFKPAARKRVMHLAAAVGLIGALGGIMPLTRGPMDLEKASVRAGLLMIVLCAIFVVLCIRSFVLARIARSEGLPEERPNA
jgi:hypothetical protein